VESYKVVIGRHLQSLKNESKVIEGLRPPAPPKLPSPPPKPPVPRIPMPMDPKSNPLRPPGAGGGPEEEKLDISGKDVRGAC
jgi:hypothetical protein